MNTIFMNSKNSNRLLLNSTDKIVLRRKDKYIPLSNLSIYYTWINIKKLYQNNNLNYLMDHIPYQIFKIILNLY